MGCSACVQVQNLKPIEEFPSLHTTNYMTQGLKPDSQFYIMTKPEFKTNSNDDQCFDEYLKSSWRKNFFEDDWKEIIMFEINVEPITLLNQCGKLILTCSNLWNSITSLKINLKKLLEILIQEFFGNSKEIVLSISHSIKKPEVERYVQSIFMILLEVFHFICFYWEESGLMENIKWWKDDEMFLKTKILDLKSIPTTFSLSSPLFKPKIKKVSKFSIQSEADVSEINVGKGLSNAFTVKLSSVDFDNLNSSKDSVGEQIKQMLISEKSPKNAQTKIIINNGNDLEADNRKDEIKMLDTNLRKNPLHQFEETKRESLKIELLKPDDRNEKFETFGELHNIQNISPKSNNSPKSQFASKFGLNSKFNSKDESKKLFNSEVVGKSENYEIGNQKIDTQ